MVSSSLFGGFIGVTLRADGVAITKLSGVIFRMKFFGHNWLKMIDFEVLKKSGRMSLAGAKVAF